MNAKINVLAILRGARARVEVSGAPRYAARIDLATLAVVRLLDAAYRLEARGWFAESSCADAATAADMAAMRAALASIGGDA